MKPELLARKSGELSVSGEALTGLMADVLAKGRPFRFRARGTSMSPLIKDGDVVTVVPLSGAGPRAGEIVAFLHPSTGKAAVHRIVRAKAGRFVLRGDNAGAADGAVPADRILGVVTGVERAGRRIGPSGRPFARALAFLSLAGGLARGLDLLRRLAGRGPKRTR